MNSKEDKLFNIETAKKTFGIQRWGNHYFDINNNGHAVVKNPEDKGFAPVSFFDIIQEIQKRGLKTPLLLRIEHILEQNIHNMNKAFHDAIKKAKYQNYFRGVYPLKVNPQEKIVKDVVHFGDRYKYGLEVGSKAEMLAALATLKLSNSLIVCNGYKARDLLILGYMQSS